jgi:hypothetical protein
MCTVLLPPGVNPIAVNKYIDINIDIHVSNCYVHFTVTDVTTAIHETSVNHQDAIHWLMLINKLHRAKPF